MGEAYQKRAIEHCGVVKKKLCRYNPNAVRSRLPQATIVMPYKNSSQIVIGDRSNTYARRFVSNNKNMQTAYTFQNHENPGISAARTAWLRKRQVE